MAFQRWVASVIVVGLLVFSIWRHEWFWPSIGGLLLGTAVALGIRWSIAREWKGILTAVLLFSGISILLYSQMQDNLAGLLVVTMVSAVGVHLGKEMEQ